MANKKTIIWCIVAGVVFALLVWLGIGLRSAIGLMHNLEKQGHAYLGFFVALDHYTQQSGELPETFDELVFDQAVVEYWEQVWQEDMSYLRNLVSPDFSVPPRQENLILFAPGYETKASWAYSDCEWYWEQVVENCQPTP